MKEKLMALAVLCPLLVCGCDEEVYTIHMAFEADGVTRQIVCSEDVSDEIRGRLKGLYAQQTDPNTFAGSFGPELPNDVGGFGRCVHLRNPMGDVHIYVERFRGDDAQGVAVEEALEAGDRLVDLIVDLLEFELGDNPHFGMLETFCQGQLREDVKDLVLYSWMADRGQGSSEEEISTRVLLYLYERDYFSFSDVSRLAATTNVEASILQYVQRLISRKLGYSDIEDVPGQLRFLQDPNAVQQSILRFLASPGGRDKVLAKARITYGDPNLGLDPNSDVDPNWMPDADEVADALLEAYGARPNTVFFVFDFFSSSGKVNVQLDCPRRPFETNGQWHENTKQVTWSGPIPWGKLPFVCYAGVGRPDHAFQQRHFGRAILVDEPLLKYAFWYKGLTDEQRSEWDGFLLALDPNEDISDKVESFRFKSAPPASPDSDGDVRLLSDLPRELLLEGLRTGDTQDDAPGDQE